MSLQQSVSPQSMKNENSFTMSYLDDDELDENIEMARERTDSDLKSDEILCNYGDKVLLVDDFYENNDNTTMIPQYKPADLERGFQMAQVRCFVANNQIINNQVYLDISPDISSSNSIATFEEDKSEDIFSSHLNGNLISLFTHIYVIYIIFIVVYIDQPSLSPSRSYSSISQYLTNLAKKKLDRAYYIVDENVADDDVRSSEWNEGNNLFNHINENEYTTTIQLEESKHSNNSSASFTE